MALPSAGKLVRDRIPEVVRAAGREPDVVVITSDDDYTNALDRKLVEEVAELRNAGVDDRVEELADVYEVLLALARAHGLDWHTVEQAADAKRSERGGFDERLWMISISAPGANTVER